MIRVGKKLKGKGVFGAEALMAFHRIQGDAQHHGIQGMIFREIMLEMVPLKSAASRLVLWIEIQHYPFAFVIGERDRATFL